ncbi:MAG: HAMP domain-containing histidine kinase [Candidatus Eisenbacteria bacterium]|nr:HAMP domain-containing histidine kinase [Candidatus Eisenbacteria bacterium]
MAHEINQPLQAIQFASGRWRIPAASRRKRSESHVAAAKTAVERMRKSVDGFLRVVRMKPMVVEWIPLNPMLEQVLRDLETEANLAGLELDLDLDAELPEPTLMLRCSGRPSRTS